MKNTNVSFGGVGFTGLLTIVFITLKLLGVINWSWWWVLSPAWTGTILAVLLFIVAIVLQIIVDRL